MSTTIKVRSKLSPCNSGRIDLNLPKSLSSRNLCTSNQAELSTAESLKLLQKLKDSKSIQSINLQIPSLRSPDISDTIRAGSEKRVIHLKGYCSKINLKTYKHVSKEKKVHKESRKAIEEKTQNKIKSSSKEAEKIKESEVDFLKESSSSEGKLEKKLMRALKENIRLKKIMREEVLNDCMIEEMMKSFTTRLQKFLYE